MESLNREEELAALNDLLQAAKAGRGGALVLRGELGVGLSALLESAVRSAPPMRVARIRGVRAERDLDFAAAHQLCASMLDLLEGLPDLQREVLESAFGLSEGRGGDRFRVGLALLMLLSKASEQQPLLCAVDDAQWLDAASAEALAFVARRLDRQAIALVIAVHEPIVGRARLQVSTSSSFAHSRRTRRASCSGPSSPGRWTAASATACRSGSARPRPTCRRRRRRSCCLPPPT